MASNETDGSSRAMMGKMLALATHTAGSSNDLAVAAGQVIAKRMALGVAAAVNPMAADHAEFARMVPEKFEAFSAAGIAMFQQSEEVTTQITRFASDEVMTTARAAMEMISCIDPLAVLEAQCQFAQSWFDRAASNFMALGMLALGAHAAALTPIKVAVAANTERLG